VIGLAVARALAARGREVLVLEAATSFGQGISSRNSEVIHAGIHYPRGSLKAGLCVRGRRLLYRYCESRGISHRRCGKLIVATSVEQHDVLLALQRQGIDNDVQDLVLLDAEQTLRLEPELHCTLALLSPSTGIVDSHAFMLSLLDAKPEALDWLENAVNRGFINYPALERTQLLDNLRGEERFKKLMERVKYEWEHFEI